MARLTPRCAPVCFSTPNSNQKRRDPASYAIVGTAQLPSREELYWVSITQGKEKVQLFLRGPFPGRSPSGRTYFARARVRATTDAAPAARRQAAHSARVAPLVTTSSTSATRFPASSTSGRQA